MQEYYNEELTIYNKSYESKPVFISVIIMAYNRKEFLLNAVKSALNQTLLKDKYEIMVIKNYSDDKIDKFIEENNIKNILSDEISLSGKIVEALKIANGNIISFLEDDDLFLNNKLEYIHNLFTNNNNLVYHHNKSRYIIYSNNNIVYIDKNKNCNKIKNKSPDFNMSSISIRKYVINLIALKKITTGVDSFMYYSAIESNKEILIDNKILTCYRYHNLSTNLPDINFNEYKDKIIKSKNSHIENYNLFINLFKNKNTVGYIKAKIFWEKLILFSLDKNYTPVYFKEFLLYFKNIKGKLFHIFEYMFLLIFNDYGRKIINNKRMKKNKLIIKNILNKSSNLK